MSYTNSEVSKVSGVRDLSNALGPQALELHEATGLTDILEIDLENGQTYAIDKNDSRASAWTRFLELTQREALPIFLEAEVQSRIVRELLPVYERRVDQVDPVPVDGRMRVVFKTSPALFFLNPALPKFLESRFKLESAARANTAVLVTHHPLTFEVLDVRDAPQEPVETAPALPLSIVPASVPVSEITLERAFQVFQFLAGQPDIPFFFVRDCCSARAHKMCLLLEAQGIVARKLWNYGHGFALNKRTLRVKTPRDPSGQVCWTFHVAPIVNVSDDPVGTVVIDPSIFDRPVAVSTWLLAQNDDAAFQETTDASNYGNKPNSLEDTPKPDAAKLKKDLKEHAGESILLNAYHSILLERLI